MQQVRRGPHRGRTEAEAGCYVSIEGKENGNWAGGEVHSKKVGTGLEWWIEADRGGSRLGAYRQKDLSPLLHVTLNSPAIGKRLHNPPALGVS